MGWDPEVTASSIEDHRKLLARCPQFEKAEVLHT